MLSHSQHVSAFSFYFLLSLNYSSTLSNWVDLLRQMVITLANSLIHGLTLVTLLPFPFPSQFPHFPVLLLFLRTVLRLLLPL